MSKGPSTFRKADIKRGVEALKSAGLKVSRVQIDKSGKLEFVLSDGNTAPQETTPLDSWTAAHAPATEGH